MTPKEREKRRAEVKKELGKILKQKRKEMYPLLKTARFQMDKESRQIYPVERGEGNYTINTIIDMAEALDLELVLREKPLAK